MVCSPGLHPAVDHPCCCWILRHLRELEEFVQGRLGRQECSRSGLQYLQPLISQVLPSETLVTKWVWTEMPFLVDGPGSKGLACGWHQAASPQCAWCGTALLTRQGVLVPATSQLSSHHPQHAEVRLSSQIQQSPPDICWATCGSWLCPRLAGGTALGSMALEPPARLCLQPARSRHPSFTRAPTANADILPLP